MTWKTICEKIAAGRNREGNNASILFITVLYPILQLKFKNCSLYIYVSQIQAGNLIEIGCRTNEQQASKDERN